MRGKLFVLVVMFAFLGCSSIAIAQLDSSDTTDYIEWDHKRPLSWSNFQGKPDSTLIKESKDAASAIIIRFEGHVFDFKVRTLFDPSTAWSMSKTDMFLLEHEQIHFDIAELLARKMRQEMTQLQVDGETDLEKFKEVFSRRYSEYGSLTTKYDEETVHGTSPGIQNEWKAKIAKELESLSEYAVKIDYE